MGNDPFEAYDNRLRFIIYPIISRISSDDLLKPVSWLAKETKDAVMQAGVEGLQIIVSNIIDRFFSNERKETHIALGKLLYELAGSIALRGDLLPSEKIEITEAMEQDYNDNVRVVEPSLIRVESQIAVSKALSCFNALIPHIPDFRAEEAEPREFACDPAVTKWFEVQKSTTILSPSTDEPSIEGLREHSFLSIQRFLRYSESLVRRITKRAIDISPSSLAEIGRAIVMRCKSVEDAANADRLVGQLGMILDHIRSPAVKPLNNKFVLAAAFEASFSELIGAVAPRVTAGSLNKATRGAVEGVRHLFEEFADDLQKLGNPSPDVANQVSSLVNSISRSGVRASHTPAHKAAPLSPHN